MNHARRLPQRFSLQVVKGVRLLHRSVLHTCTYIIHIMSLLAIYQPVRLAVACRKRS